MYRHVEMVESRDRVYQKIYWKINIEQFRSNICSPAIEGVAKKIRKKPLVFYKGDDLLGRESF